MGLFNLFKKHPKIQDDLQGNMFNNGTYLSNPSFIFIPINTNIYMILSSVNGRISEGQRQFYLTIQHNYPMLRSKISAVITEHFRNWKEDFKITDFDTEFTISAISLPKMEAGSVNWEIRYTSIHDKNHDLTIALRDLEPIEEIAMNG